MKKRKPKKASDGGSKTLLGARLGRPGGFHGRRKASRRDEKNRAIALDRDQ